MAKRSNHYDVAFEHLLRLMRRPYVSVNENRRALVQDTSLKSMDFIVYSRQTSNLLIDVKGRQFSHRRWESWTMEEDVSSLMRWEEVFGGGFRALFVFAYEMGRPSEWEQHPLVWDLKGRRYAFYGVWASDYAEVMRTRSRSWGTVCLATQEYHRLRQPLMDLL